MDSGRKIPVLIVTGFLGAGKTTFINHLVRANRHLKLALIENEFGETSIDQDLIVGIKGENIFDLSSGCICCTISNEFSLTLLDLSEKLGHLDYLLIETTGIANLSNVIRPFYSDENLKKKYQLSGNVCIVDAMHFDEQLAGPDQQMQVILSDYLVVNKAENSDASVSENIIRRLHAYNNSSKIEFCQYSQTKEFDLGTFEENVHTKLEKKLAEPVIFRLIESPRYTTFTHKFEGRVNLARFQYWFNYFAAINQSDIYRIKGVLFQEGSTRKTIVQSVGGAVSYSEGSFISPGEKEKNTLVFIGRDIDFERISFELNDYLSEDEEQ